MKGYEAIEHAKKTGVGLYKYEDPTGDAREITIEEAEEIAKEDPDLIYATELPLFMVGGIIEGWIVLNHIPGKLQGDIILELARFNNLQEAINYATIIKDICEENNTIYVAELDRRTAHSPY